MSIVTIKNNKGGVGKSWLTLQLAHGTQLATDEKILILTSDSQNNILQFAGIDVEVNNATGLETWLSKGDGELIRLRKDLFFIPILNDSISKEIESDFHNLLKRLKQEYKYIFIDSTPTLKLDELFINEADSIIIPTFLDSITTASIKNFLTTVDIRKVKAIVPNRFTRTKKEKEYWNGLKEILENEDIILTNPIQQSSEIGKLIDKGKTIWQVENKKVEYIKDNLIEVIREIL